MEGKDFWKIGWPELICIKCDKGENLLVCSENDCLLAVHEECIGCPARFDDAGNFYCPHCFHRQTVRELQAAWENAMSKKEALSIFERIGQKMKLETNKRAEAKKLHQREGVLNLDTSTFYDGRSTQDVDVVPNEFIRTDEDAQNCIHREGIALISPCRETDSSQIANQCDAPNTHENATCDRDCHRLNNITGKQTNLRNVDASECDGSLSQQFELVKDDKLDQAEHEGQGCYELNRIVENHQEDAHIKDFNEIQDRSTSSGRKVDNIKMHEEHKISKLEEENIQDKESQSSRGSTDKDCTRTVHMESKRRLEKSDSIDSDSDSVSVSMRNEPAESRQKSRRMNPPRRSSSALRAIDVNDEHIDTSRRSKRAAQASANLVKQMVASRKRRRLMWKKEEEEMLKEGVHRFAATAKQNLPWRKILEFGRHVFDESRTPVDLKDKWRNMLSK